MPQRRKAASRSPARKTRAAAASRSGSPSLAAAATRPAAKRSLSGSATCSSSLPRRFARTSLLLIQALYSVALISGVAATPARSNLKNFYVLSLMFCVLMLLLLPLAATFKLLAPGGSKVRSSAPALALCWLGYIFNVMLLASLAIIYFLFWHLPGARLATVNDAMGMLHVLPPVIFAALPLMLKRSLLTAIDPALLRPASGFLLSAVAGIPVGSYSTRALVEDPASFPLPPLAPAGEVQLPEHMQGLFWLDGNVGASDFACLHSGRFEDNTTLVLSTYAPFAFSFSRADPSSMLQEWCTSYTYVFHFDSAFTKAEVTLRLFGFFMLGLIFWSWKTVSGSQSTE